jgi:hypothetical protein
MLYIKNVLSVKNKLFFTAKQDGDKLGPSRGGQIALAEARKGRPQR